MEPDAIRGTWIPVEAILEGKKLPEEGLEGMVLIIDRGTYSIQALGGGVDRGTVALDGAVYPLGMDLTGTEGLHRGRTRHAIYEIAGDWMRVCYAIEGSVRPASFDAGAGDRSFLVTYRRT